MIRASFKKMKLAERSSLETTIARLGLVDACLFFISFLLKSPPSPPFRRISCCRYLSIRHPSIVSDVNLDFGLAVVVVV